MALLANGWEGEGRDLFGPLSNRVCAKAFHVYVSDSPISQLLALAVRVGRDLFVPLANRVCVSEVHKLQAAVPEFYSAGFRLFSLFGCFCCKVMNFSVLYRSLWACGLVGLWSCGGG